MGLDFAMLTTEANTSTRGRRQWLNQAAQTSKREVFFKHKFPDERSHEERGTVVSEEPQVPEDGEIRRTPHKEGRIGGKGQR